MAILLGAGFAAAKIGQFLRLPSVTGYILAGLMLGPSGLHLVMEETIGTKLEHFTQIALMLIAFGIGEHLDLKRLHHSLKIVGWIGFAETTGAFICVGAGVFVIAVLSSVGPASWGYTHYLALTVLLGAVSVATAPATTLHVLRELKAAGPLTIILMAVVAVNNGLALMIFGLALSVVKHFIGSGTGSIHGAVLASLFEIAASLLLGIFTGLLIDFIVNRLQRQSEMLIVGLSLLLLCGEGARLFGLSPLLAGMAAGFTIVNRDFRDVRLFRALNSFEPPIYVLFFTLAGTQLHLSALSIAGWLGLAYFFFRVCGKVTGAYIGSRLAAAPKTVQHYLGYALVPQAGIAIGLIFLIKREAELAVFTSIITPVVLAGVVLSELVGPVCARFAVEQAGEAAGKGRESDFPDLTGIQQGESTVSDEETQLIPWTWDLLQPAESFGGYVLFDTSYPGIAAGLARIATLIAHHHGALPMALQINVQKNEETGNSAEDERRPLFCLLKNEIHSLGYPMKQDILYSETMASGIIEATRIHKSWGIILGCPLRATLHGFEQVVETVAMEVSCPIIVVRFAGVLHTERILVPVVSSWELHVVSSVVAALSGVGKHRITMLRLMPSNSSEKELEVAERKMMSWAAKENLLPYVHCQATATDARVETIIQESRQHDLLVMAAGTSVGFKKLFFGSLAEGVAKTSTRPMLIVYGRTS